MCIKMAEDADDDALMLSVIYCELMHNNLYWSLTGSSLLVQRAGENTRSDFTSAVLHSAVQLCVNASIEIHRVTSAAHPTLSQRSVHV